jgi:hypothetical protein
LRDGREHLTDQGPGRIIGRAREVRAVGRPPRERRDLSRETQGPWLEPICGATLGSEARTRTPAAGSSEAENGGAKSQRVLAALHRRLRDR